MSRYQFRGGVSGTLAELDIDTSRLWGTGGVEYPNLYWQMRLGLLPQNSPHIDYAFRTVESQLYLPPGQKIADARPITLHRVIHGYQQFSGEEHPIFEFPLDARRIAVLEKYRQGGSFKLRLDVQLSVDEYSAVPAHPESKRPAIWGLRNVHRLALQEEIQISQSDWIEHVLTRVGYGEIHVIELPAVPIESCEAIAHSFKALKQAEEKHRLGFYDDAVGKCRMAVEKFFDQVAVAPTNTDSRKIPVLKKSWETKLGQATYVWLNGTLGAVKDASNPTHHSPNAHYSQFDSQMILSITTAVVAYIARSVETQENK